MNKVFNEAGVQEFAMFDFDAGKLLGLPELEGQSLYTFRPVQRTGKVHNFDAMSDDELKAAQEAERKQRVEMMAALVNEETLAELESEGKSVIDLIPPPLYL